MNDDPLVSQMPEMIRAIDHIGIRVSDRQQSVEFYHRLGFVETAYFAKYEANEMVAGDGVRINLIFNAARQPQLRNRLLDMPIKYPGVTHPAFVVDDVYRLRDWLLAEGIVITEDIHSIGSRRIALFFRDPDGNVLEFNQLLKPATEQRIAHS